MHFILLYYSMTIKVLFREKKIGTQVVELKRSKHTTSILRRDPMRAITRPGMCNTTQNHMFIHKKPGKNEDA